MTEEEILSLNPGQELDVLVARHVMGHPSSRLVPGHVWGALRDLTPEEDAGYRRCGIVHAYLGVAEYSTGISAAWSVLERIRTAHPLASIDSCGSEWLAWFSDLGEDSPRCATAPEAICKAALLLYFRTGG